MAYGLSWRVTCFCLLIGLLGVRGDGALAAEVQRATLRIHAGQRSEAAISNYITGKFCEHLGSNIYNGMCAQILRNPTFADYPFWGGAVSPDGRTMFLSDDEKIADAVRHQCARLSYSSEQIASLIESRKNGLAFWWMRVGPKNEVRVSADAGPHGGRAQRVEIEKAGQGIAQLTYLPLHRVRKYEYEMVVRSPDLPALTLEIGAEGGKAVGTEISGISRKWQTMRGTIEIDRDWPDSALYRVALTGSRAGQFVIERMLLWPADHVKGADADVVRLLKASRLPVLRWPGGNFVSGYHWEDGVGPMEKRPTRPNWAWGGVEPNLFGTDEFIEFCRAVRCEPMICINAGDGSPEEAANWVQYCNGPLNTPMGAKRAANGHIEPYDVKLWEVGNELWGSWQVHWTTAKGYPDRYREFSEAMLTADESIKLYGCGAPVLWGKQWNEALIAGAGKSMSRITDHPLIGGSVPASTDPLDVYRSFMAVPDVLEGKWAELRKAMEAAGVAQPRLGITELQMFAHLGGGREGDGSAKLTSRNLVNPSTQAEALYDTLMYHAAIRLSPFVDLVTHSATVNHGGGLRKERERVYANPCYYAQAMFAEFAGATPVKTNIDGPVERFEMALPDVKGAAPQVRYGGIAAMAALGKDGSLLISIVNRGMAEATKVGIEMEDFKPAGRANVVSLSAEVPWASNTLDRPEAIRPSESSVDVKDGKLVLDVPRYTVMRVRVPAGK